METNVCNNSGALPGAGPLTAEAFNWPGWQVQDGGITLECRGSILSLPVDIETQQRRRRRGSLVESPKLIWEGAY